jgi:hypothetical protein
MNDTTTGVAVSAKAKLEEFKRLKRETYGLGLSVFASKLFVKECIEPINQTKQRGDFENADFSELANIIETYLNFDMIALTDGQQIIGDSFVEQKECSGFLDSPEARSDRGFFIEKFAH